MTEALQLAVDNKQWNVVKIILSNMSPWDIRSASVNKDLYKKLKTAGIFEELRRMRNDPREIQTGNAWKSHLALAAVDYVTKEPGRKLELLYVPIRKLDSREYHIHEFEITMTFKSVKSKADGVRYKFGMEIHIPGDIAALIRDNYDTKKPNPDTGRQEKVHRPTWYTDIQNYVYNQIMAIRGIFWMRSRPAIGYKDYYTGEKSTRYGGTLVIDNKFEISRVDPAELLFHLLADKTDNKNDRKRKWYIRDPKEGGRYLREQISKCIDCGNTNADDLQREETSDKIFCDIFCQKNHYSSK